MIWKWYEKWYNCWIFNTYHKSIYREFSILFIRGFWVGKNMLLKDLKCWTFSKEILCFECHIDIFGILWVYFSTFTMWCVSIIVLSPQGHWTLNRSSCTQNIINIICLICVECSYLYAPKIEDQRHIFICLSVCLWKF